jgi:hypothetical protein
MQVAQREELEQALQLTEQAVQVDYESTKKPTLHRAQMLLSDELHWMQFSMRSQSSQAPAIAILLKPLPQSVQDKVS